MIIFAGIVTVAMPRCRAKLKGDVMKKHILRSAMFFAAGALTMALVVYFQPPQPAQGSVAHGNDKFTMVTVPMLENDRLEAVFVLNHLTGRLVGGLINEQLGSFGYGFEHNVAADFKTASKDPKYAVVSGGANLRGSGGVTPAVGVLYIAELSSGAVIAYAIPRPTTRNAGAVLPLVSIGVFKFADSIGQ
jgi:hypothetical protein